eukprot:791699-Pelagomonas_calceolata.AAC.12
MPCRSQQVSHEADSKQPRLTGYHMLKDGSLYNTPKAPYGEAAALPSALKSTLVMRMATCSTVLLRA